MAAFPLILIEATSAAAGCKRDDCGPAPTCAVTEPAIAPRVRSRSNLRVPDLAVTGSPVESGQLALPDPLLIVEILSPTNEAETWDNVWT
jgi:hypothetical protein